MQSTDIPNRIVLPFANNAGGAYIRPIPVPSQIGITDGAASFHDGFPPLTATPIGSGGKPPDIKDMNGILFDTTGWSRWLAAGGPVFFDSGFSSAVGGYPKWAALCSSVTIGLIWISTVENNTTNPDSDPTSWQALVPVPATLAEIQAGVNNAKFVTPYTLSLLRAAGSDVRAGTNVSMYISPAALYAARSTGAEVRGGTDDHGFVTPAGLGACFNASPGILYFPGGVMMQYGTLDATLGTGNHSQSYNTPFPVSVDALSITTIMNTNTSDPSTWAVNWRKLYSDLNQFSYHLEPDDDSGSTIDGISWTAWGRYA